MESISPYSYVFNNPFNLIDPPGMNLEDDNDDFGWDSVDMFGRNIFDAVHCNIPPDKRPRGAQRISYGLICMEIGKLLILQLN